MRKNRSAFTLIEMAMVLIVMGIIVAGSTRMVTFWLKQANTTQTHTAMEELAYTLQGYAMQYGRLPSAQELWGVTLQTHDAWNHPYTYIVDEALTRPNGLCATSKSALSVVLGEETKSDYAYVLASSGKNRNLQTALTPTRVTLLEPMQEGDGYSEDGVRMEPYDDIIVAKPRLFMRMWAHCKEER
ncbi:MAG: hypothetical protein KU37_05035 [Sulfuricurvum sp. PC08-66]|nr:MAG: hypothetical protein KU37_05035 [Sulfuricurvum sp. PC08-66]